METLAECKICDKLKRDYLSAKQNNSRRKEDFLIGSIIILIFGGILELLLSRFFISLLNMTQDVKGNIFSMSPGWLAMTSFVISLIILILYVMIRLFSERLKDHIDGNNRLKSSILKMKEESCPSCQKNLTAFFYL